jgi:hypothetical protein
MPKSWPDKIARTSSRPQPKVAGKGAHEGYCPSEQGLGTVALFQRVGTLRTPLSGDARLRILPAQGGRGPICPWPLCSLSSCPSLVSRTQPSGRQRDLDCGALQLSQSALRRACYDFQNEELRFVNSYSWSSPRIPYCLNMHGHTRLPGREALFLTVLNCVVRRRVGRKSASGRVAGNSLLQLGRNIR